MYYFKKNFTEGTKEIAFLKSFFMTSRRGYVYRSIAKLSCSSIYNEIRKRLRLFSRNMRVFLQSHKNIMLDTDMRRRAFAWRKNQSALTPWPPCER